MVNMVFISGETSNPSRRGEVGCTEIVLPVAAASLTVSGAACFRVLLSMVSPG